MTKEQEIRLFRLVETGDHAAVAEVLNGDGDPQLRDRFGVGLAHRAAASGDADMLRLLSELGTDLDTPSDVGNTPLMIAAANGHLAVVEMLLERGANPARRNRWGYGPAAWAEWSSGASQVKAVLHAAGG